MGVIFLVLLGTGAGWAVSRLMGVKLSPVETVVLGVLGTIVGSWIIRALLSFLGLLSWIVGAFIGVVILLWAYQTWVKPRLR